MEAKGKRFNDDYINCCLEDLGEMKKFFNFMSFDDCDDGKIDCIIEALKDYKKL